MNFRVEMDKALTVRLEFLEDMNYASYENSINIGMFGGFKSANGVGAAEGLSDSAGGI